MGAFVPGGLGIGGFNPGSPTPDPGPAWISGLAGLFNTIGVNVANVWRTVNTPSGPPTTGPAQPQQQQPQPAQQFWPQAPVSTIAIIALIGFGAYLLVKK